MRVGNSRAMPSRSATPEHSRFRHELRIQPKKPDEKSTHRPWTTRPRTNDTKNPYPVATSGTQPIQPEEKSLGLPLRRWFSLNAFPYLPIQFRDVHLRRYAQLPRVFWIEVDIQIAPVELTVLIYRVKQNQYRARRFCKIWPELKRMCNIRHDLARFGIRCRKLTRLTRSAKIRQDLAIFDKIWQAYEISPKCLIWKRSNCAYQFSLLQIRSLNDSQGNIAGRLIRFCRIC